MTKKLAMLLRASSGRTSMRRCTAGCRRSGRYTARRAARERWPNRRKLQTLRALHGTAGGGGAVAEQAQTIGSAVQSCVFVCRALELGRASVDGAVLAGGDARGAALAGGLFSEGRCCPARGTTTRAAGLELELLRHGKQACTQHVAGLGEPRCLDRATPAPGAGRATPSARTAACWSKATT